MGCECGRLINQITGMEDEQPLVTENGKHKYKSTQKNNINNIVLSDDDYSDTSKIDKNNNNNEKNKNENKIKNKKHDKSQRTKYRSFIIIYHIEYGFLLLESFKPKKGKHYQLAGGHIDKNELRQYGIELASKMAAIRELYEETGLNFNNNNNNNNNNDQSTNRIERLNLGIENRLYFYLEINNNDSLHITNLKYQNIDNNANMENNSENMKTIQECKDNNDNNTNNDNNSDKYTIRGLSIADKNETTLKNETYSNFYLKLSHEHTGFTFVKNSDKACEMIMAHSGGYNSIALKKFGKMRNFSNLNNNKSKKKKKDKKVRKVSGSQSKSKSKSSKSSKSKSNTIDVFQN